MNLISIYSDMRFDTYLMIMILLFQMHLIHGESKFYQVQNNVSCMYIMPLNIPPLSLSLALAVLILILILGTLTLTLTYGWDVQWVRKVRVYVLFHRMNLSVQYVLT